jgi:hypothetical protein
MDLTVVLIIALCVVVIWLIVLTALIAKEKQFLKELGKGAVKKDIASILRQLNTSIKLTSRKLESHSQRLDAIEKIGQLHLQKLGFVRFNPFSDTGGDQSFSLCLLDQNNNGIVITSLHSRAATRLYAKEIKSAQVNKSEYSEEEWKAYTAAKNYQ